MYKITKSARCPSAQRTERIDNAGVYECLLTYLGPIRVILCMASVTLLSFLSWVLWCTKPFIIWCALAWMKRKQNRSERQISLWGQGLHGRQIQDIVVLKSKAHTVDV